ncbi:hypothetical protein DM01DRAFT_1382381 [Hesseltinella vesiculosa]|uniref:Uncharacterized protein n=1 Tax=Hesseltinella vesiculosa TaxID=101127 RepID=A0A1X2GM34_9FUNG|nr:hypothetical protein DM01DRAFT_1382381 [Hesseltinella vesiculosa]
MNDAPSFLQQPSNGLCNLACVNPSTNHTGKSMSMPVSRRSTKKKPTSKLSSSSTPLPRFHSPDDSCKNKAYCHHHHHQRDKPHATSHYRVIPTDQLALFMRNKRRFSPPNMKILPPEPGDWNSLVPDRIMAWQDTGTHFLDVSPFLHIKPLVDPLDLPWKRHAAASRKSLTPATPHPPLEALDTASSSSSSSSQSNNDSDDLSTYYRHPPSLSSFVDPDTNQRPPNPLSHPLHASPPSSNENHHQPSLLTRPDQWQDVHDFNRRVGIGLPSSQNTSALYDTSSQQLRPHHFASSSPWHARRRYVSQDQSAPSQPPSTYRSRSSSLGMSTFAPSFDPAIPSALGAGSSIWATPTHTHQRHAYFNSQQPCPPVNPLNTLLSPWPSSSLALRSSQEMSMEEHSNSIMRVLDQGGHDDFDLPNQTHARYSPNLPVHSTSSLLHLQTLPNLAQLQRRLYYNFSDYVVISDA